jgi:multimeric flavodoxin WrbA
MCDAVLQGANDPQIDGVDVSRIDALDATVDDVVSADALILGTPENFGYMSGALKHFFDSVYQELGETTASLPYCLFVKAGNDGTGAVAAVAPLATGLRWRRVLPPLIARGDLTAAHLEQAEEMGATMAAGLAYGGL